MKKIQIIISAIFLICVLPLNAQDLFLSAIPTTNSLLDELPVDIKVSPQKEGSSSSSNYSNQDIDKSFDGDMETIYHSAWGSSGTANFPVTLVYAFPENSNIDYLVYHPRTGSSTNGNFKKFELYYKLRGADSEVKEEGEMDFNGSPIASSVNFGTTLADVEYIKFVLEPGSASDGGSHVSCAEMEFYKKSPNYFDYTSIFEDEICSELKEGITIEDINAVKIEFYKKLAQDLFYGEYDSEYRVQEYESYLAPEVTTTANKGSFHYGKRDNPTGIYALKGDVIAVIVEESVEESYPSLFIQEPDKAVNGTSFALQAGFNKITASHDGLMYILYYTPTGTEQPVKINIVNGTVNGYFDIAKHTNADWPVLLANATFQYFDVKGNLSLLNFETEAFRTYTNNKIEELLQAYDNLVHLEFDFGGMYKYNRVPKTRMHFQVMSSAYSTNFMHATNYYTGYNDGNQSFLLNVDRLTDTSYTSSWAGGYAWGPAHEVGHVNQVRPALKWQGMTEVTNNIMSQYVTITWGLPSRLNDEILKDYGNKNRYTKAIETIVQTGKAHNNPTDVDVFCQLVPFWQLKLYIHDVLGNDDFYKDLYEDLRLNANPVAQYGSSSDGMCQLKFTKVACEVSGLDLTEFFEDWGFYTPISSNGFIVSQNGINTIKAEIAALGLSKPVLPEGKNLYEINDKNTADFIVE